MKRLLLTGATGFIGRQILAQLDFNEWEVIATCRHAKDQLNAPSLTWIETNLLDSNQHQTLFSQARATHWLHLAWYTEHGKFWNSEANLTWTTATLQMISAFRKAHGQHLVIAGTCAEYDWNFGYCREDETPLRPISLYGCAKDSLRRLAEAYCRAADLEFAWGRIFSPFGPGEDSRRFVPAVIGAMLSGTPVQCSHGNQFRDYLHVCDVASGLISLLSEHATGACNIASGTPVQLREIVFKLALLCESKSEPDFGAVIVAENDPLVLFGDNRKLLALGWKPKITLDKGLQDTVAWWKNRYSRG